MADLARIARTVQDLSDNIGREILSKKPQPIADVVGMAMDAQSGGPAKNPSDLGMKVNDKLNDLHEYARVVRGGQGEYPITGFAGAPDAVIAQPAPSNATIRRTTIEDELKQIYGPHATAVMDNIVQNQAPGVLGMEYPHPGGAQKNLTDRKFVITLDRNHPDRATLSGAQPQVGYIALNPRQADRAGVPLSEIFGHELGHLVGPGRNVRPMAKIGGKDFFDDLFRHSAGEVRARSASDPRFAESMSQVIGHTNYTSRPDELLANLAHMMRHEYGLTGRPVITPQDRIKTIQKWINVTPRVNPDPSSKWMQFYGPDPILQHGPDAGNPAAGYEMMRQMFRNILRPLPGKTKTDVIKAMGFLGSTEAPKGDEVYG